MLRIPKYLRLIFAIFLVVSLSNGLQAQAQKVKKEKKTKVDRVKKKKEGKSNIPSIASTNHSDDLRRFLLNFNNAYQGARKMSNDYRLARVLLEDQVADLEAVVPVNQAKVVQLESKLKALRKQEKVAQSNLKKYKRYATSLASISELTLSKQQKLVAKVESGYQKMPRVFAPDSVPALSSKERPVVTAKPSNNKARATKKKNSTRTTVVTPSPSGYSIYSRSKDVLFNPPSKECAFRYRGMDEFLGKEKVELEPQKFFFHTDPDLRQYMKGKEYIECSAGLATSTGGLTTLNIEVTIRSQNAQREFGGLQKGNPLTIKLVNGEIVKLLSVNSDTGTFDESTGLTTFRNQFLVQKGEEKSFLESEIDKIRLVWSNGYEDYDVYEVDFMMNQLNCLYNN